MKSINIISRCQEIYRDKRFTGDIPACRHTFVLAICRNPGYKQEELSKDLCLNKSTVTRALDDFEKKGYVKRVLNENDKRETLVYPTEKMTAVLPKVREITVEWKKKVSEGISEKELEVFDSVLKRIEDNARRIIRETEE